MFGESSPKARAKKDGGGENRQSTTKIGISIFSVRKESERSGTSWKVKAGKY